MWTLKEAKKTAKQIDKAPKEIVQKYEFWKSVAETQGPMGLMAIKGFRDHALRGEWQGARSFYLNDKWRVIYVVRSSEVYIFVLEVTAHDYRKKS